ncbi:MAG: Rpp14/Pop5 family protein [Thermofilaceae archaeon]
MVYRYMVLRIQEASNLVSEINNAVLELWGVKGLADTMPEVVHLDLVNSIAILRVKRRGLHLVKAALAAYRKQLAIILKVTGSYKRALKFAENISKKPSF